MHDIVHDFATSLREGDDLISSEETSSCEICGSLVSHVKQYRSLLLERARQSDLHVCDCLTSARVLDCRLFGNISMEIEKFIHLRNLSFYSVNVNENDIRVICLLYKLQSLVLSQCDVREIPREIGNLSQLRHLDLSGNGYLKELPESICDLHELRSLDVRNHKYLSTLPQGIDCLVNLKHLLVEAEAGYFQPLKYPQGLANLTGLQTLDLFEGGDDRNKLGLLNKLNRLSGSLQLVIELVDGDDDIVEQAQEAKLRKKVHLQKLVIYFSDSMDEEKKEEEVTMRRRLDIMEALEPHPNLQSLKIWDYKGSRFPDWVASPSFHQLREITLQFSGCLSLPHLGNLPCLEELMIFYFCNVEFVGREFLGITSSSSSSSIGFPKLKKLKFVDGHNWKEWEDIMEEEQESAAVSVMPSLMELEILGCYKLRELPHRLLHKTSSLQRLNIDPSCRLLHQAYMEGPLTKFISHIPNVGFWW